MAQNGDGSHYEQRRDSKSRGRWNLGAVAVGLRVGRWQLRIWSLSRALLETEEEGHTHC